jgi:hypothetical protein
MTQRWNRNKVLALGLAGVLVLFACGSSEAAKQPKIKFSADTWDFGKVKQGQALTHEFSFENAGQGELTIDNVETSCGCTAALASDKSLAPGRKGKIKVTFNTTGYSGTVTKYVFVDSNDPDDSRVQLKVQAMIEVPPGPRADLSPYALDLGLLLEGEPAEGRVTIANRGELELTVDVSQKNVSFFEGRKPASFPLKVPVDKEVTLTLRMNLANRVGPIRGDYVTFRTNDPQRPNLFLTVSGYIVTKDQLKDLFNRYKNILK